MWKQLILGVHIQVQCAQEYSCKIGVPYLHPVCSKNTLAKPGACASSQVAVNHMCFLEDL